MKKEEEKKKEEAEFQKRLNDLKNDIGMGIAKKVQMMNHMTQ